MSTVEEGETVAIIGANGAGKTTSSARGRGRPRDRPRNGAVRRPADRRQDPARDRAARHRHGAGRTPAVSKPFGGGKSAARQPQRAQRAVDSQTRLRAVSAPVRFASPARAVAVGRPATDGGGRPRADVQSAASAVRRAVAWTGAGHHPRHLPMPRRDHRRGHDGRAGRAGHQSRARCLGAVLLFSGRPAGACRADQGLRPRPRLLRLTSDL